MAVGRKTKPTALKLVQDTQRSSRANPAEPSLPVAMPKAPETLSQRAKESWDLFAPQLVAMGVLTEADFSALELLCETRAEWLDASDEIDAHGRAVYESVDENSGKLMIRTHPSVTQRADAARRMQSLLSDFGLSPSSRAKVGRANTGSKDDPSKKYFA
jgi:P27 family predicted phage terminase small subunit